MRMLSFNFISFFCLTVYCIHVIDILRLSVKFSEPTLITASSQNSQILVRLESLLDYPLPFRDSKAYLAQKYLTQWHLVKVRHIHFN